MRKMLVATLVLCLASAVANATVTWNATYLGSYPVQDGGANVDAWNLSFSSDSDLISGVAFDLFQPGYQIGWPPPAVPPGQPPTTTPTPDLAQYLSVVAADCHFNVDAADFVPAITTPAETNDMSFGLNLSGEVEGIGGLTVESGLSLAVSGQTLDLANLAWLSGTVSAITDVPVGNPIAYALIGEKAGFEYEFWFYVPEPASMTMLGVGAVAMFLRRRRS